MRAKRKYGKAALPPLLFAALAGVFVLLWGAGKNPQVSGSLVEEISDPSFHLLLFADWNGKTLLSYSGSQNAVVVALDSNNHSEPFRQNFNDPLYWAAPRGGSLFVLGEWEQGVEAIRLSPALEIQDRYRYPLSFLQLVFFDCSPEGGLYAVKSGARDSLSLLQPDGSQESLTFSEEIDFLAVSPSGKLYLSAGGEAYLSQDGSLEGLAPLACEAPPVMLVGENVFLDGDAMACRVEAGSAIPLFHCPSPLNNRLLYCADEENGLVFGQGTQQAARFSWDGTPQGSCSLEGRLLALSKNSALCREQNSLYLVPLDFGEPVPSPAASSEPSPLPSPTFMPPPDWKPEIRENYLFAPAGATVPELLALFYPEAVLVKDAAGKTVLSGKLSTGMTAGSFTLIVRGDCDGTGTVTGSDVRAAQSHMLGKVSLEKAFFQAADLDGDGEITAADLAFLGIAAIH